jgi:phosphatidylglycerol:prolipoprotein diacylglycerol transferase
MFSLFGINFYLYGLILGIGIFAGLEVAIYKNQKNKGVIEQAFGWMIIGGLLGARIYHVVDYWDRYYRNNLSKIPAVWEGGLGIWGAIFGSMIALLFFSRLKKKNLWHLFDMFSVGAPLAQAIGRLGNFVNGELYGKNGEPLFAYEAILNLILFIYLWRLPNKQKPRGKIFARYLIGYGIIRILLENLRPEDMIWKVAGIPVAVIFGVVAIAGGTLIIYRKRS